MPKLKEAILDKLYDTVDPDDIKQGAYEVRDLLGALHALYDELEDLYSKAEDVLEESGESDHELLEAADEVEGMICSALETLEAVQKPVRAITDLLNDEGGLYEGEDE